jgi:hypothetical protein
MISKFELKPDTSPMAECELFMRRLVQHYASGHLSMLDSIIGFNNLTGGDMPVATFSFAHAGSRNLYRLLEQSAKAMKSAETNIRDFLLMYEIYAANFTAPIPALCPVDYYDAGNESLLVNPMDDPLELYAEFVRYMMHAIKQVCADSETTSVTENTWPLEADLVNQHFVVGTTWVKYLELLVNVSAEPNSFSL